MIRRRDLLNKIEFTAAEGIWRCALPTPGRYRYRRYSSLPQDGVHAKSDGLDRPSADESARTSSVGDHGYGEKDLKNTPPNVSKNQNTRSPNHPLCRLERKKTEHRDLTTELDPCQIEVSSDETSSTKTSDVILEQDIP